MNLLKINDLTEKEILDIYKIAENLEKNHKQYLKGKTFVLFFPETSIRTRITFQKGLKLLGAESILFPPATLDKREKLVDVMGYLENYADGVIARHKDIEKLERLSEKANIPVINAMTAFNHPCEILTDLYSIRKRNRNYKDLVYTFVGEKGNISQSWAHLSEVMNLKFNHISLNGNQIKANDENYVFNTNLDDVLKTTDVILTDSLPKEFKNEAYIKKYQITMERMKSAKKGAIINPCPPFYRGEEVSEAVIDSHYFVGYKFKESLLYVHQAIILYCSGIKSI